MIRTEAAVRERLVEQLGTAEGVTESATERVGRHSSRDYVGWRRQRVALASNSR